MQGQQGFTIWFTGMPGTGKRTLAAYMAPRLQMIGRRVEVLDGDEIRSVLLGGGNHVQPGEGFDVEVRRLGFLAKMLTRNGVVTISTSISPVREAREEIRKQVGRFVEIYVDCAYEKLMTERERVLYRIPGESPVPGHNAPYDVPASPDLHVDTGNERVEESAARIFNRLREMGYVTREEMEILAGGVEPPPLRSQEALEEPPQARKAREKAHAEREKAVARAATKAAERAAAAAAEKAVPAKAEKAPAKAEKAPAKPEKAPAKAEKAPAKPEKAPAKAEKAPAKAEKAPAKPEKPAKAEKAEKSVKAAKGPAKPEKAPAKAAQAEKPGAKGASKAAPRREAAAKVVKPAPKAAKPAPKAKAKGKR